MKLQGIDFQGLALLLAVAGVGYVAWRAVRAAPAAVDALKGAAGSAVQLVNPADRGNIVNRGVEAVGSSVTGDPNWTLGGAIYDWLNPPEDINAHLRAPKPAPRAPGYVPPAPRPIAPTWDGAGFIDPGWNP